MVDMAGSASVIALFIIILKNMNYSCLVGATHHDQVGSVKGLPGAKPEFFFAPLICNNAVDNWGLNSTVEC